MKWCAKYEKESWCVYTLSHCNTLQHKKIQKMMKWCAKYEKESWYVYTLSHCNTLQHKKIKKMMKWCAKYEKESWYVYALCQEKMKSYAYYVKHGVASISRLLKMIGLFCKRAL